MRNFFVAAAVWLYIFIILGFLLHTSVGQEQVFGKYSWSYLVIIIFVLLLFILYIFVIRYTGYHSKYHIGKKLLHLSPRKKFLIILLTVLLILGISELFIRMNGLYVYKDQYMITNFHPFLQYKLTKHSDEHINEYGFRGDDIKKEKQPGVYRIIIFGGSTAYGVSIPYQKTTPKLLQDMLTKHYGRKVEVLNAGVPGYTSEHSVIDYQFRASEFKPDLVIIWHGINDMSASCVDPRTYSFANPYSSDYSHIMGPLANMVFTYFFPPIITIHLISIDNAYNFLQKYMYTDLANLIHGVKQRATTKIPQRDMTFPSLASYQRNLKYFITAVRSDNAKLILGNQPNMLDTYAKGKYNPDGIYCYNGKTQASISSQAKGIRAFNTVTKKVANENNVPFIDLDSALPRTSDYFFDGVHWTEKGHSIAAHKLYDLIIKQNFIGEEEL